MPLHFAYGSNMSRALMGARCPGAAALGTAELRDWRFIIGVEGYASMQPRSGATLRGVLWRLTPRDLAALNAYECIDGGVYLRRIMPVRHGTSLVPALAYVMRREGEGRPRPAYIHLVAAAAREWGLPESYIGELQRWEPSRWRGVYAKGTGELG
jgi:AIG2-like family